MKLIKTTALLAMASMALASCGEADRCASASNPAECRAWGDAGGDIEDYLIGGMVGYMLANRGGQTVIVRDSSYHGSYRPLRRPLYNEQTQLRRAHEKIERQRVELRRQQEANRRQKAELRAQRKAESKSSFLSSSRSWSSRSSSSRSSYRSSSSRRR